MIFSLVIGLFIVAYLLPFLFLPVQLILVFFVLVIILDYLVLFHSEYPVRVHRQLTPRFSNGDDNEIVLVAVNQSPRRLYLNIIDEIPFQFQKRDFSLATALEKSEEKRLHYDLRPTQRGEYVFHDINCFVKTTIGLVNRRVIMKEPQTVKVYPSYKALREFELKAFSTEQTESGTRKMRKIGRSLEFEQIKEYVTGDDIRDINWKATARKGGQLMVNNFMDERSQQIYCLIDKGRVMKMPFNGMTLLDYAINASLVLSHVALVRQDKAGLITFAEDIGHFIRAQRRSSQMGEILETLYAQQTHFHETDYEKLYALLKIKVPQRSFLVLFTNFETIGSMQRQLPYLRMMARRHLLMVVFFENVELKEITESEVTDIESLYIKTIAEKFAYEKRLIVKELQQHGIITLLTDPAQLTIHTVNKYLELKARQVL